MSSTRSHALVDEFEHSKKNSRDMDRGRSSNRERERERDQEHYNRDFKDRSSRSDRGRGKYDNYDRNRSRDFQRHRDRDYDSHKERGESREKSRNRSRSPSRSKRTSGFDMGPPVASMVPGTAIPGQLPGIPPATQGLLQNMFPFGSAQLGSLPLMPAQAVTQQATRHARKVYVGGLPPLANEQTIATFFSHVMAVVGGNSAGPGDAVVNVYINHEKKFAFVEMRTVEEASNAMALDGIIFEGVSVRVRRPTDYNPSLAAALGPSQPSPHLNLAAAGLTLG